MNGTIHITEPVPTQPTVMIHYLTAGETVKTIAQHHVPRVGERLVLMFRQNDRAVYVVDELVRFPEFYRGGIEHVDVRLTRVGDSVWDHRTLSRGGRIE